MALFRVVIVSQLNVSVAALRVFFIGEGIKSGGAMSHDITPPVIFMRTNLCVLNLLYNCLESGGVVESKVGKHLTVDLYA